MSPRYGNDASEPHPHRRGSEDIHQIAFVRNNGSRFPTLESITAMRDNDRKAIGYLLS